MVDKEQYVEVPDIHGPGCVKLSLADYRKYYGEPKPKQIKTRDTNAEFWNFTMSIGR